MNTLIEALCQSLPEKQVITDELRRLAYGTDASFYRLIPEVVVVIECEADVQALLRLVPAHGRTLTFRAAGTSLSGQAITDGVLALIGEGFATCVIAPGADSVRLGPGIIAAEVNRRLAPFARKIGPDPASINACKIGGIAANNASGMCCGTTQNSYHTLSGLRIVLADGAVLDTEDPLSVARFRQTHAALVAELDQLGRAARADAALAARIRHKYRIKNTTGYGLNALVDYLDPIDILAHLMIGSEGTLGFISSITYRTVPEDPFKASALVFFANIETACKAVIELKSLAVSAVELLDRAALRSVQDKPGMPVTINALGDEAAALLIEVRAGNAVLVQQAIDAALGALAKVSTILPPEFSSDPETCEMYWKVRKGTFPSVGARRRAGTTVIIEDVAFPVESLSAATLDLQVLLRKHGYHEAIIFGHALEGNLHFVFTQDFSDAAEVDRYAHFMADICHLVVDKYDGALKAEHGTGRNMAPFVEMEWGPQATDLMRRIKQIFDPRGLLNPGVILNDDPQAHLQHLKLMPPADALIDHCIECGFCEPLCPSHQLTLSPRQRVVAWRALSRGLDDASFAYHGLDTCAGCGLCASACPVGIDTGELVRRLRGLRLGNTSQSAGRWVAKNFDKATAMSRVALAVGHAVSSVLGDPLLGRLSRGFWKNPMPGVAKRAEFREYPGDPVVYFPSCSNRVFGSNGSDEAGLPETIVKLLVRAGYSPRLPPDLDKLCCGQMLASKGMAAEAATMAETLAKALLQTAADGNGGFYPVIMDASACSVRMQAQLAGRVQLLDFHEFAHDALVPRLTIRRKDATFALHINCSVRHAGSADKFRKLAAACAEIIEPAAVGCCGFAGDRGFVVPELNVHALRNIHQAIPPDCCDGLSTNRTCEIGLTAETGRRYHSIAYLLEECSR